MITKSSTYNNQQKSGCEKQKENVYKKPNTDYSGELCFKLKEKKDIKFFSSTLEELLGINIPNSEETFYRYS